MKPKKIKIVIETETEYCEIPLSIAECRDLYDTVLIAICELDKMLAKNKLNHIPVKKITHLIHDVIDEGRCYKLVPEKKGKDFRMRKCKEPYYTDKKPRWTRK